MAGEGLKWGHANMAAFSQKDGDGGKEGKKP